MSSSGKCGRGKYGNGKNEEIVHLTVTLIAVNERKNKRKCKIWPLFTDFALLSHCTQTCWTRVFSLSVVPTGLWMNPPASVSVKTDSPKTAAVQAGNWTIKPVSKSSDITYTTYLKFLWRSDLTLREFMNPPVRNISDIKTGKCGREYLIRSLCFN